MEDTKHRISPAAPSQSPPDPAEGHRKQALRQADAVEKYAAAEDRLFDFKGGRATAKRSPAQREASRRNGTLSRGPVTSEGKAISSANSIKHGLLSKIICPPPDSREHNELYRKICRELRDQFNPQTFTDRAQVDSLAHDYLQRATINQMLEALQRPEGMTLKDDLVCRDRKTAQGFLKQIEKLTGLLDKHQPPSCNSDVAAAIADKVATYVTSIEDDAVQTEDTLADDQVDAIEKDEDQQIKAEWARLRPHKFKLVDRHLVLAVLSGARAATPALKKRLHEVLIELANRHRQHLDLTAGSHQETQRKFENQLLQNAIEPDKMIRLQEYASILERSIQRKIARLTERAQVRLSQK